MTRSMILAAGHGTRLRPLTDELPKPLVPVGDRPAIAHIAARLAAGGIRAAVLNTHHLAAAFSAHVLDALPIPIRVVHEPEILGTAGGLANAAPVLGDGDVLVWNGDILIGFDVGALLEAHRQRDAAATLALAPRPAGEGTVGTDAGGRVVRLRGERFGLEAAGGDYVGVQVVGDVLRRRLPARGCLVGDALLPWLRAGGALSTFPAPAAWDDVGTVGSYLRANARWLDRAGLNAYIGPDARVADGVDPTGSVIGAGARVSGAGALRACVIWPGAQAEAPLDHAVVTPAGRVVRAA